MSRELLLRPPSTIRGSRILVVVIIPLFLLWLIISLSLLRWSPGRCRLLLLLVHIGRLLLLLLPAVAPSAGVVVIAHPSAIATIAADD
jgi:hypothetical protein